MKDSSGGYYRYWAKTNKKNKGDAATRFHLLPYHLIDVCECGLALLDRHPLHEIAAERVGCDPLFWKNVFTLGFLFHDIGKMLPAFQKMLDNGEKPEFLRKPTDGTNAHHTYGTSILCEKIPAPGGRSLMKVLLGDSLNQCAHKRFKEFFLHWVAGHHGFPARNPVADRPPGFKSFLGKSAETIEKDYREYVGDALELYSIDFTLCADLSGENLERLEDYSWIFNGFLSLSDWLGSSDYFPPRQDVIPLADYRKISARIADGAVSEIRPYPKKIRAHSGIASLFPALGEKGARPMQRACEEFPVPGGPSLWIVEDGTGSGKTEAGLFLASRLAAKRDGAGGLYFGLPTSATANGIFRRLESVCPAFFEENERASSVLAHSTSKSFLEKLRSQRYGAYSGGEGDSEDSPSADHFVSWFFDNNKKALLADFGVGTIDQALLSTLKVKYGNLRLAGLFRKVLVLDEIHSFDAYMNRLIENLLKICLKLEVSVVLMSATLADETKEDFAKAYAAEDVEPLAHYPLITLISGGKAEQRAVECAPGLEKKTEVETLHEKSEALGLLAETAKAGKCACWIRNTVADAVEACVEVKEILPENGEVILFHSAFTRGDRAEIEEKILKCFGENSSPEDRAGKIVVATQVVEQSLDLDFDELVTDLAPIDLIIQREGRYRRHRRDEKGKRVEGEDERGPRKIRVFGPKFEERPKPEWYGDFFTGASYVYRRPALLWLTAKTMAEHPVWSFPEDARKLIASVHGAEAQDGAYEFFEKSEDEEFGAKSCDESIADQSCINLSNGYGGEDAGDWMDERRYRTRLGEDSLEWELCPVGGDGITKPMSRGGEREDWEAAKIKIRAKLATEAAGESAAALKKLNERLPENFRKRLNPLPVFPVEGSPGLYRGEVHAGENDEKTSTVHYSREFGLIKPNQFEKLKEQRKG